MDLIARSDFSCPFFQIQVIITDDVAEADKFVAKWKALSEVEKEKKKEATPSVSNVAGKSHEEW